MKCYKCNGEVIWQNDFATEDLGIEEEGIVSYYICSECGAFYEVIEFFEVVDDE